MLFLFQHLEFDVNQCNLRWKRMQTLRRYQALIRKSKQREELFKSDLKTQNNTIPSGRIHGERSRGSLLREFRRNRAHRASRDSTEKVENEHSLTGTVAEDENGGEYVSAGKSVEPAEEPAYVFRTSRLSEGELESRAKEMMEKLESVEKGELELAPKTVERYKKFVARYRDLEKVLGLIDESDQENELSGLNRNGVRDPIATGGLRGSKKDNKMNYEEQFQANRDMFLAKSSEAREKIAEKLRNEIADHDAGINVLDVKVYNSKKRTLARYERLAAKKLKSKVPDS